MIVHGVEESEAKDAAERRESDRKRVEDMFGELGCEDVRTEKVIRLGKKGVPVSGGESQTKAYEIGSGVGGDEVQTPWEGKKLENVEGGRVVESLYTSGFDPNGEGERREVWQEMRNRMVGGEKHLMLGEEGVVRAEEGSELG